MSRRESLRLLGVGSVALAAGTVSSLGGAEEIKASEKILTRTIPSSGEAVPVIGLGTWQTFDVGASEAERAPLAEVLAAFAGLGGRVVDSSPMYGRSEEVLGDLAARVGVQEKLFVATKVWTQGRQAGVEQMEESMRRLRRTRVDLIQVHNLVDAEAHLETLRVWKAAGRVRYLGLTHYTTGGQAELARWLEKTPVDFIQINYSAGEREAERRLLPLARERGVAVIANRPFSQGALLGRLRARALPGWAAEIGCESWAQVLLKFIVGHPAITCAIPATSKVAHLRDNMQAAYGALPDEALRERIAKEVAGV
ncbi:aldo/keto reductase [Nibricoccus aquaticus]|uniref:Aldo/keto reductase n=2 Tax=Nibricoccus aquaticus TaxID=2576891 RepID=A0A290QCW6_9BACT|nr:aldo/keto reductase [Nibricoccus aquaticus]